MKDTRTDRRIIEESIPPQLIRYLLECSLSDVEKDNEYREAHEALLSACDEPLHGVLGKRRDVLLRRLERIMKDTANWMRKCGIGSRKAIIMSVDWVIALNDAGIVKITHEGFISVIEDLHGIFQKAPAEIPGWEKIEKSAIKTGYKLHAFLQKEGYYR